MEVEQVLPDDEFRVRGALKRRCLLHPDGAGQGRNMDTTMEGGTYDVVLEENSDLHFGLLMKASTVELDKTGSYHQNQFSSADRRAEILSPVLEDAGYDTSTPQFASPMDPGRKAEITAVYKKRGNGPARGKQTWA